MVITGHRGFVLIILYDSPILHWAWPVKCQSLTYDHVIHMCVIITKLSVTSVTLECDFTSDLGYTIDSGWLIVSQLVHCIYSGEYTHSCMYITHTNSRRTSFSEYFQFSFVCEKQTEICHLVRQCLHIVSHFCDSHFRELCDGEGPHFA